jgi:hypothetical protein
MNLINQNGLGTVFGSFRSNNLVWYREMIDICTGSQPRIYHVCKIHFYREANKKRMAK